jgi:hypothetical protein
MSIKVSARVTVIESGFASAGTIGSRGMSGRLVIRIQLDGMSGFILDMTQGEFGRGITIKRQALQIKG